MLYLILHFLTCVLYFAVIQRPLFIIHNRKLSKTPLSWHDIPGIYRHGLCTDCKVAAYLTAIPLLLAWAHTYIHALPIKGILIGYDIIAAIAVALLVASDTILYRFWQYKIEKSVLVYLKHPEGAFASVSAAYLVGAVVAVLALAAILAIPLIAIVPMSTAILQITHWVVVSYIANTLVFVIMAGLAFAIIRGLSRRPDGPSVAYYSKNQFLNHAAVNAIYNFIYSLSIPNDFGSQFQDFDPKEAEETVRPLYPTSGTPQTSLLREKRPNIVFIVWESLCTRFIESLGGKPGVMPQFERIAPEGILFTHCYANSFRTDRALVSILSGLPAQPTTSVILNTSKLPHLPGIPRLLRDECGYRTTAVHGGNLLIFHKNDYYLAVGHDKLVQQKDFPHDAPTAKWGVHDGYVFDWLAQDIINKSKDPQPFYTTFQTLSSHEPYDVPYHRIKDNIVDNAFAYVDDAFGRFIDTLKASPAWDNLLIVLTGDHGINLTEIRDYGDRAENTHLPLLMLGGAINGPRHIDTLMCQTDIAATLLGQMGLDHSMFPYSRDVLADTYTKPFAFHTYNNGFILRQPDGYTFYDNAAQMALEGDDPKRIHLGKLILQQLYSDIDKL